MFILAIDQGTTSSRALLIDHKGSIIAKEGFAVPSSFPKPGWVEQDPEILFSTVLKSITKVIEKTNISLDKIKSIGITNQRETTIVWDRKTLKPIYPAIVWQDRRTASTCDKYRKEGYEKKIQEKTGLLLDHYFSALKIAWILDQVKGARDKAKAGDLAFGTVDSWITAKLTDGKAHVTDPSNASRTLLFNIHTLSWDDDLCALFDIPKSMLPEVYPSSYTFANTGKSLQKAIPITAIIGDQQSALFGENCLSPGMVKATFGTGCFVVMNLGDNILLSKKRLLTSVAWQINDKVQYMLEGSIFHAGSVMQWLEELGLLPAMDQIDTIAKKEKDSDGIFFVPAFTGLGAPYWNPKAEGMIMGLKRETSRAHIIRAALEASAFQANILALVMEEETKMPLTSITIDGGLAASDILSQFFCDLLQKPIIRPKSLEITALGAGFLSGLASGFWKDLKEITKIDRKPESFKPQMTDKNRRMLLKKWDDAIQNVIRMADA
jgi:glycerol kinase